MLLSLALIMIMGFSLSGIFNRIHLPGLLGMILTGIILGPFTLNFISEDILNISTELRQIALIIILTRAGLAIDIKDLKKVGRPAVLMCFVPATFEILAVMFFAPLLLDISLLDAALMGTVLAAVSPAVIVPRMLHLMESGHGTKKNIPQLIMAGASVDDIYVIVLFTALMGLSGGESFQLSTFIEVPVSIVSGLALGVISGAIMVYLFKKIHMRDTVKVILILCTAFLFVSLESYIKPIFPVSGLLAVMAVGGTILKLYEPLAKRLKGKFSKIWVGAEILLFVLVGAAVNLSYVSHAGFKAVALILLALCIRVIGVQLSLLKTSLNIKERLFCAIAYLPKATVQAAIGALPLAAGLDAGPVILAVAVMAIMITAPLGAIGIDLSYKKWLGQ